jgi:predicted anti-sigma-YlaC factor YlaD
MRGLVDERNPRVSGPSGGAALAGLCAAALLAFGSCSIERMALTKVAGMLSSTGSSDVFSSDNDPELVGDALPFAIKLYESLLASLPGHDGLRLRTGSLYVIYANAFIQTPAEMTPRREAETKEFLLARAKNLYLRGRDILFAALERKNPSFLARLKARQYKEALAPFGKEDVPFLYWAAVGWVGAFAVNPFDMTLGQALPQTAAMMERVSELDPGYGRGAIHVFYINYYGSLPDYMGGSAAQARDHFEKAQRTAGDADTSALMALATTVCVKEQNYKEFRSLLRQVLEFDVDKSPENRLVNVVNRRKARWLLDHADDLFIVIDEEGGGARTDRAGAR